MKIYVAHATSFDHKPLYQALKTSPFWQHHTFILPHENSQDGMFSKSIIATCDLLIAEVSTPSLGTGIEIGWADAAGVPVACMYRKGTTPSGALKHLRCQLKEYENESHLQKLLEAIIL